MRIDPAVVFRVLGDGAVLVHLGSNEVFELNETGAAIWTRVERGDDVDGIVADLVDRFDVDDTEARRQCEHLLTDLQRRGLLAP